MLNVSVLKWCFQLKAVMRMILRVWVPRAGLHPMRGQLPGHHATLPLFKHQDHHTANRTALYSLSGGTRGHAVQQSYPRFSCAQCATVMTVAGCSVEPKREEVGRMRWLLPHTHRQHQLYIAQYTHRHSTHIYKHIHPFLPYSWNMWFLIRNNQNNPWADALSGGFRIIILHSQSFNWWKKWESTGAVTWSFLNSRNLTTLHERFWVLDNFDQEMHTVQWMRRRPVKRKRRTAPPNPGNKETDSAPLASSASTLLTTWWSTQYIMLLHCISIYI